MHLSNNVSLTDVGYAVAAAVNISSPYSVSESAAANADSPSSEVARRTGFNDGDLTLVSAFPDQSTVWQSGNLTNHRSLVS